MYTNLNRNLALPLVSASKLLRKWALALICLVLLGGEATAQTITNQVRFTAPSYSVSENFFWVTVPVIREGNLDNRIEVDYVVEDISAVWGIDYFASQSGTLIFGALESIKFFQIQIFDDSLVEGDKTLGLRLTQVRGGLDQLGDPSEAIVTIIDDEVTSNPFAAGQIGFSSSSYVFMASENFGDPNDDWDEEFGGAILKIVRTGGALGKIEIDWRTLVDTNTVICDTNGLIFLPDSLPAVPGEDYFAVSGRVTLTDFQMSTNIYIPFPPNFGRLFFVDTNAIATNFCAYYDLFLDRYFDVEITAVRAAPDEDPEVVRPTLSPFSNTRVQIVNNDPSFGFSFVKRQVSFRESRGEMRLWVNRSPPYGEGVSVRYMADQRTATLHDFEWNTFQTIPGSDYAAPFIDFLPPYSAPWRDATGLEEGRIEWAQGDLRYKSVRLPLLQDTEVEFNEDIAVELYKLAGETDGFVNYGSFLSTIFTNNFIFTGGAALANFTILFDDQAPGAADRDFNPDNNALTDPPFNQTPGANNTVQAVEVQADHKIVIGGDFTAYNASPRNRIARVLENGQIDNTFNPGTGADNFVSAIALLDDGKMLIAGGFTSYNGTQRYGIARLMTNGLLDTTFNPGLGAQDGAIRTIALQSDGKILIGGEFTQFDGTNAWFLARLHENGKLDTSFNDGEGPDGPVHSIALGAKAMEINRNADGGAAEYRITIDTGSSSGTLTVDYDFLNVPDTLTVYYEGQQIYNSGLINGAGSIPIPYGGGTSTFLEIVMNEGSGLTGTIWYYNLFITPNVDPRPIIGGNFNFYDGVPRNYIARLTVNGRIDTSFNPGTGADNVVYSVAKQGNKVLAGGAFTQVDNQVRPGMVRFNEDGSLDFDFDPGSGANGAVFSVEVDHKGRPLIGGLFTDYNSTRRVGLARLNFNGTVDTTFMDTAFNQFAGLPNPLNPDHIQSQENFIQTIAHFRSTNVTFLTNVVITNDVTNIVITIDQVKNDQLYVGGRFRKIGGGTARDGLRNRNYFSRIVTGEAAGPGNIEFGKRTYSVDEDAGRFYVTLVRTNGSLGEANANFQTLDPAPGPGAANAPIDYMTTNRTPVWPTSWDIERERSAGTFGPNFEPISTNRSRADFNQYSTTNPPPLRRWRVSAPDIWLTITEDEIIEGDETFDLRLSNPGNSLVLGGESIPVGTALGFSSAKVIVVDNDFDFGSLGFETTEYHVNENERVARVTVTRRNGSTGAVSVDYETLPGGALDPADFTGTRGTLRFESGITTNSFTVRIRNDIDAELEERFRVILSNPAGFPTNVPPDVRLDPARSLSEVVITDDDFASGRISFALTNFMALESASEAVVTVTRTGGNLNDIKVNYSTSNGTAIAGVDFLPQSGVLQWTNGEIEPKTIRIPLINNDVAAPNKFFNIALSNPFISGVPDANALGVRPTATVEIVNDDAPGSFEFSQQVFGSAGGYRVDEIGGRANITVLRVGGVAGTNRVSFSTTNITAVAGVDYVATNGVLEFLPGELSKTFSVVVNDNSVVNGDKIVGLVLSNGSPGTAGPASQLTIVDNELIRNPAGSVDSSFVDALGTDEFIYTIAQQRVGGREDSRLLIGGDFHFVNNVVRDRLARLNADGTLDRSFEPGSGPNGSIRSMVVNTEGRIIVGGVFTQFNGTNRNHIARINIDGQIDPTFNPGSGTDNPVYSLALQADGKVIAGGDFASFNGIPRSGVVRLTTNGVNDASFVIGTGANGSVLAIAIQGDGKILLGGTFTTFNGSNTVRLVRLNSNGSVDPTFSLGTGADSTVRAVAVQPDGKILVGGSFTNFAGTASAGLVRLNPNGSVDTTFGVGTGADGAVNTIVVQIDGRILVGGDFTRFNGVTRNRLTRLLETGGNDPTINFGSGFNATVSDVLIQPDNRIVAVGGFTEYAGTPRNRIVRIHGGSLVGPGALEFTSAFYMVSETATNALIAVRRVGGTTGEVRARINTVGQTATSGEDYQDVSFELVFPNAETFRTILVPIKDDILIEGDENVALQLADVSGGAVLGPQPTATLIIQSDDSLVEFSAPEYSISENFVTGSATITIRRTGSIQLPATITFATADLTATAGADYSTVNTTVTFAPGESMRTIAVPISDDSIVEGDERIRLTLTNLIGSGRFGTASATLTIVDNDFAPGRIRFTSEVYSGTESGRVIIVTLRRTEGTTGVVSVDYATSRSTATPLVDYEDETGIVSFSEGETTKSFDILIYDDDVVEGNEDIIVTISNPRGGATILGSPTARATIVDDDLGAGSIDNNFNPGTGADRAVLAARLLPDGDIMIGGEFTSYNGTPRSRVARLDNNAALDGGFNPGTGPNNYVADLEIRPDGEVLIAGQFTTVGGVFHNRIALLTASGQLDPTFNLPLGLNAEVSEVVRQPDGKVLIGGFFSMASAAGRNHIARLLANGTVDTSFDVGTGADNTVHAIALQSDGKILVGGSFATFNGRSYRGLLRLNADGSIDDAFNPGFGFNGAVRDVLLLPDGDILVGGEFSAFNGTARTRLARLNSDGSIDLAFSPATGPNGTVLALALQADGKYFIGGDFTAYNGVKRVRIARIMPSGELDAAFNPGDGPNGSVLQILLQPSDQKVIIVGRFTIVDQSPRNGIARFNNDRKFIPTDEDINLTQVERVGNGLRFNISTQSGFVYEVEATSDLVNWVPVRTIVGTGAQVQFSEEFSAANRFYRVRLVSP